MCPRQSFPPLPPSRLPSTEQAASRQPTTKMGGKEAGRLFLAAFSFPYTRSSTLPSLLRPFFPPQSQKLLFPPSSSLCAITSPLRPISWPWTPPPSPLLFSSSSSSGIFDPSSPTAEMKEKEGRAAQMPEMARFLLRSFSAEWKGLYV